MNEMTRMQKMLWIVALGIMALCFLVSAFMPQHRDIAHGIILGTGVSCLNVLYIPTKFDRLRVLLPVKERRECMVLALAFD